MYLRVRHNVGRKHLHLGPLGPPGSGQWDTAVAEAGTVRSVEDPARGVVFTVDQGAVICNR